MAGETLKVLQGSHAGAELPLDSELVIGRGAPGTEAFDGDSLISRRHARITRAQDGRLVLEDLGSTNGTFLNGWQIPSPQILSSGDRIQAGNTLLTVAGTTTVQRRSAILRGVPAPEAAPPPKSSLLYVEGLRKSYGPREVLKGVDLEVQPGEVLGLLGANGAGKTTMVSIIAGLRQANGGTVRVAGVDALKDPHEARKHLGLAPQDLGIYPTMSVERNLRFFGEMAGLKGRLLTARVEQIASALSLTELFPRRAVALSGGQKRRLHTAMAMLHSPPLLILDEPTVGADVRTRTEILDVVKSLAAEGRAVVYSTHYLPEIEELGASVAILLGGEIIARGSIAELVAKHSTVAVELYFDGDPPQVNIPNASLDGSIVRIKTDDPAATAGAAIRQLGPLTQRLRGVEIVQPSLESVYLSLTEKRYSAVQPGVSPAQPAYQQQDYALAPLPPAFTGAGAR